MQAAPAAIREKNLFMIGILIILNIFSLISCEDSYIFSYMHNYLPFSLQSLQISGKSTPLALQFNNKSRDKFVTKTRQSLA
jgi:hypothetical protein